MISAGDLRKGLIVEFDGVLYQLLEYERFKLGKGNSEARIRLNLKDMRTGKTTEKSIQTSDRVKRVYVEHRPAQYSYGDGDMIYFIDTETFEQIVFPKDRLEDVLPYLKENQEVALLMQGGQPLSIEIPPLVELKIVETQPGFKGDTATAGNKPAKMETGLTVQVPLFLKEGDSIKVDSRTGQYSGRVS
ncbi:MAG: elongation factor P [Dehalococcoidia bacterium]|nr:elongation factor P [Dehalococcoidia bacterium]